MSSACRTALVLCVVLTGALATVQPPCRTFDNTTSPRERQIQRLRDYAHFGEFPLNVDYNYTTPIFVDVRGVPCAVAYLMSCDGYGNAVADIAKHNVKVHVMDVTSGPMMTWLAGSGLWQWEAANIQPSYGDMTEFHEKQCASEIAQRAKEKASSAAALNHRLDTERIRLRSHFDAILAQLESDSPLHSQLSELLHADATKLQQNAQNLTAVLQEMVITDTQGAAFVASHICTFAPVLSIMTNAESYMGGHCQPDGGGQWLWRRTEPFYGPPWVRTSAAVALVEALLSQKSQTIQMAVASQLSQCLDTVFESAYLPHTEGTPAWELAPHMYGACPLTRAFSDWYSRSYTGDAANWNAYARIMTRLQCPEYLAPVIANIGEPVHPYLVYDPEAWWAQTPWLPRYHGDSSESFENERSNIFWSYDSMGTLLWSIDEDNVRLAALNRCKAASCVPDTAGPAKASMTRFSSCVLANVWEPFKRACQDPAHACNARITMKEPSGCLLNPSLLQQSPSYYYYTFTNMLGWATILKVQLFLLCAIVVGLVWWHRTGFRRQNGNGTGQEVTKAA